MTELHKLIKELDSLPNNPARKKYLNDVLADFKLSRHHNRRLAGKILKEDNFIDKIYRKSFIQFVTEFLQNMIKVKNKKL